jgi:hypothetical protein
MQKTQITKVEPHVTPFDPASLPPWTGSCFRDAVKVMLQNLRAFGLRLIHAEIKSERRYHAITPTVERRSQRERRNEERWVARAWVEAPAVLRCVGDLGKEGTLAGYAVLDYSHDDPAMRVVVKDEFYQRCSPRNVKSYTHDEMRAHPLL